MLKNFFLRNFVYNSIPVVMLQPQKPRYFLARGAWLPKNFKIMPIPWLSMHFQTFAFVTASML